MCRVWESVNQPAILSEIAEKCLNLGARMNRRIELVTGFRGYR